MPLTAEIIRDLEAVVPGFNGTPLTLSSFERIAERKKITLMVHNIPTHGWLFELDGRPAIAVNGRLSKGH